MRLAALVCATLLAVGCGGDGAAPASTAELIAFGSSRDGDFEIYTMRPDGSGVRQLTKNDETAENEMRDDGPVWSSDGHWIAFTSSRDHGRGGVDIEELYVMSADGSDQKRLTENDVADLLTGWTEEGAIAFWRCREGVAGCELRTIERDGGDERVVYETEDAIIGSLGPVGNDEVIATIISREATDLSAGRSFAIDLEDGRARRVANAGIPSPDGTRLLRVTDEDKNGRCLFHDCTGYAPEIYMGEKRLTRTTGYEVNPAWSPGGKRIVFARIANDQGDDYELWVMNADGSCAERLTDNGDWDWRPDWYGSPENDEPLTC